MNEGVCWTRIKNPRKWWKAAIKEVKWKGKVEEEKWGKMRKESRSWGGENPKIFRRSKKLFPLSIQFTERCDSLIFLSVIFFSCLSSPVFKATCIRTRWKKNFSAIADLFVCKQRVSINFYTIWLEHFDLICTISFDLYSLVWNKQYLPPPKKKQWKEYL